MKKFLIELGFTNDDVIIILDAQNKLSSFADSTQKALSSYMDNDMPTWYSITEELSEKTKLNKYTIYLTLLLQQALKTEELYKNNDLPHSLFIDTMRDLLYKNNECKAVHGVVGTFVETWFRNFFILERFKFCRLQFEKSSFARDEYKHLKRGDRVFNVHIPSAGPLLIDDCLTSLKQAYEYYKNDFDGDIMPIVCSSWLLYPGFSEIFPPSSNIGKFRDLFTVVYSNTCDDYHNLWRVFNEPFNGKFNHLPENTSLQRALKKYYLDGNKEGTGYGVILFDGENIIK